MLEVSAGVDLGVDELLGAEQLQREMTGEAAYRELLERARLVPPLGHRGVCEQPDGTLGGEQVQVADRGHGLILLVPHRRRSPMTPDPDQYERGRPKVCWAT